MPSIRQSQSKDRTLHSFSCERSFLYESTVFNFRCVLFLLLISGIESQCYSSYPANTNSTCTVCLLNGSLASCSYTISSHFYHSKNTDVCSSCCSFTFQTALPFCGSPNSDSSQNASGSNSNIVTIIIVVIVATIFIISVVILIICCCIKLRNGNQNQQPVSTINLQDFNMDDIAPMFINWKQNCSICLEENCNIRTRCGHCYHLECLKSWIKKRQNCPLCVAQNYNPIILHCKKCFKSLRLSIIRPDNQQGSHNQNIEEPVICRACSERPHASNDISVSLSSEGEMAVRNQTQLDKDLIKTNGLKIEI